MLGGLRERFRSRGHRYGKVPQLHGLDRVKLISLNIASSGVGSDQIRWAKTLITRFSRHQHKREKPEAATSFERVPTAVIAVISGATLHKNERA